MEAKENMNVTDFIKTNAIIRANADLKIGVLTAEIHLSI